MESYTCLLYEEIGRVARLTLNRPEKLNALSVDLHTELLQAAKQAEANPRIHAVIIRGAGRAFCAGYDITPSAEHGTSSATRTIRTDISRLEETVGRWQSLWQLRIP